MQEADPLTHLSPQRVPRQTRVAAGLIEQPLHPIRRPVPGELRLRRRQET
jgi:hypothetical protein